MVQYHEVSWMVMRSGYSGSHLVFPNCFPNLIREFIEDLLIVRCRDIRPKVTQEATAWRWQVHVRDRFQPERSREVGLEEGL